MLPGTLESLMSDTVQIPLRARDGSVRAYALIDAADAEWAAQYPWHLTNKGYAGRCALIGGRVTTFRLHRELLGLTTADQVDVDHINRVKLDCRRSNLRILPKGANAQNTGGWRQASSSYRGVFFEKDSGKWAAKIHINGRLLNLGRFGSELEAAEVARAARARLMPYSVEPEAVEPHSSDKPPPPPRENRHNKFRTHCRKGHELAGDNLRIETTGGRRCLTCRRAGKRQRTADRRSLVFPHLWGLPPASDAASSAAGRTRGAGKEKRLSR